MPVIIFPSLSFRVRTDFVAKLFSPYLPFLPSPFSLSFVSKYLNKFKYF